MFGGAYIAEKKNTAEELESATIGRSQTLAKRISGAPVVLNAAGAEIALPSLWLSRRCVVVFLRHFGCRFCKQHTQLVREMKAEYEKQVAKRLEAGAEDSSRQLAEVSFVLVGIGMASHIDEFTRKTRWDGELYVVPDVKYTADSGAYGEFRLPAGRERVAAHHQVRGPDGTAAKALAEGFEDGGFPHPEGGFKGGDGAWVAHPEWAGNAHQLGGVFVVGPGNTCDYSFRSDYAGHFPEAGEILKLIATSSDVHFVAESTKHWVEKLNSLSPAADTEAADQKDAEAISTTSSCPFLKLKDGTAQSCSSDPLAVTMKVSVRGGLTACALSVAAAGVLRRSWAMGLIGGLAGTVLQFSNLRRAVARRSFAALQSEQRLQFLTPLEVDAEIMRSPGGIACDCGFVEKIEMQKLRERRDAPSASREIGYVPRDEDLEILATMLCYVREFLAKPHHSVGRGGPVCPFIPKTLKTNCLYLGVQRVRTARDVEREVMAARNLFKKLEPVQGNMKFFRATVLIFPEIPINAASELIDRTQERLKDLFVAQGLMLGEFHLLNNSAGLRNPEFFPLRTPYPALAIRHMVPSDLPFLKTKKTWTESYLKQFDSAENFAKAKEDLRREAELSLYDLA